MSEKKRPLVIVGAGPGGYVAAFRAADRGIPVTLVDRDPVLGGVCLNRGCIPSKAILYVANLLRESRSLRDFGFELEGELKLEKVREHKEQVVKKLTRGLASLAKARKVEVIQGEADFESEDSLKISSEDGEFSLPFEKLILAVGSRPVLPKPLAIDSERVMDSTGALELEDIPDRLLVVGGGIIGLELGSAYAALGSKVSVVEMLDRLAAPVDRDLFAPLEKALKNEFEDIFLNTKVQKLEESKNKIMVEMQDKDEDSHSSEFDRVLLCMGRRPNSDRLDLEKAGIQTTDKGLIECDSKLATSNKNVYAIGDLVAGPQLAHKASAEATVAVDTIAGIKAEADFLSIPSVIYTEPEISWTGLTEEEAKQRDLKVSVQKFPWKHSGRALSMADNTGLTKLIFDSESGRILGGGIAGKNAGELIAEVGLAVEMCAVAEDLAKSIHAHPTHAETIHECAEAFAGLATHLPPKSS